MSEEDKQHSEIMKSLGRLEGLYTGIQNQVTYANGRTGKLEAEVKLLEKMVEKHANIITNLEKNDGNEAKGLEKRRDWMWGATEKILFALVGAGLFIAGVVLKKLGILNF